MEQHTVEHLEPPRLLTQHLSGNNGEIQSAINAASTDAQVASAAAGTASFEDSSSLGPMIRSSVGDQAVLARPTSSRTPIYRSRSNCLHNGEGSGRAGGPTRTRSLYRLHHQPTVYPASGTSARTRPLHPSTPLMPAQSLSTSASSGYQTPQRLSSADPRRIELERQRRSLENSRRWYLARRLGAGDEAHQQRLAFYNFIRGQRAAQDAGPSAGSAPVQPQPYIPPPMPQPHPQIGSSSMPPAAARAAVAAVSAAAAAAAAAAAVAGASHAVAGSSGSGSGAGQTPEDMPRYDLTLPPLPPELHQSHPMRQASLDYWSARQEMLASQQQHHRHVPGVRPGGPPSMDPLVAMNAAARAMDEFDGDPLRSMVLRRRTSQLVMPPSLATLIVYQVEMSSDNAIRRKNIRENIAGLLETVLFSTVSVQAANDDGANCVICREEFDNDDKVTKLMCSHVFHTECIEPWVAKEPTCPLCRQELLSWLEDLIKKKKEKARLKGEGGSKEGEGGSRESGSSGSGSGTSGGASGPSDGVSVSNGSGSVNSASGSGGSGGSGSSDKKDEAGDGGGGGDGGGVGGADTGQILA